MINHFKCLSTDLDGTLLHNGDKKIFKSVKNLLKKIVDEKNIILVICTGRSIDDAILVAKDINFINLDNVFIVSSNGANIYNMGTKKYLFNNCLNVHYVRFIFNTLIKFNKQYSKEIGLEFFPIYHEGSVNDNKSFVHYVHNNEIMNTKEIMRNTGIKKRYYAKRINKKINIKIINEIKFNKIVLHFLKPEIKFYILTKLKQITNKLNISSSGRLNIEITSKNISKGSGLKFVSRYCKISKRDLISVGDEINDIEMFKASGRSFTFENSNDLVKKYATNIVDSKSCYIIRYVIKNSFY